jgi:thiol:disulfide interchange protein/DsbC/DsbD-like thiol-disulfide interchange protein
MPIMPHFAHWVWTALIVVAAQVAWAQPQVDNILTGGPLTGQVDSALATPESVIAVRAGFTPPDAAGKASLAVTATIQPGWHIYSITQKPVRAVPTTISVDESPDYRITGPFLPNLPPEVVRTDGDEFEQFAGEVTWHASIEVAKGVDPRNLKISGKVRIQTCSETSCLQPTVFKFIAGMTEQEPAAAAGVEVYSDPNDHVTLSGRIEPASLVPGGIAKLVVEATPAEGWHIYELAKVDPNVPGNKPTLIVLTNTSGLPISRTTTDSKVIVGEALLPGEPAPRYHAGSVAWTTMVKIPADAKPGKYALDGMIGYQVCQDDACDLPRGASFTGKLSVGASAQVAGATPLRFADGKYGQAAKLARTLDTRRAEIEPDTALAPSDSDLSSLPVVMLFGFLGGFLLNFMPCVLPVIGLKILSFAEQSGRHRAQILTLNIWYSLGLMSVFLVLAVLATGASLGLSEENLGWGQQFTSTTFNIVMVGLVFAMALSFLGIWEIPIPGFASSGKANDLASREGFVGAFTKGAMATVLSTPCSGPFLGPVFGFTLTQPPEVTFLIFGAMGLGMASPYLLIGAFPRLIRFLPKPGAWMETFKHIMGFVLLGTIVFLFTFMDKDYIVPTFAMMIGIWAACWWIGRISFVEPLPVRMKAWAQGAVVALVVGWASFHWLTPHESIIPWQNFSRAEVQRLTAEGNTVLVDFTADWCLTCKVNLARAIETDDVKELLAKNKVVPLLADWTEPSDEIKSALESINRNSIPQLAIYPPGKDSKPIVLSDLISKQQVLEAIAQAGPSKPAPKELAAMP